MKKILYLHGLESKQGGEKVGFLAGECAVYAPAIDYRVEDLHGKIHNIVTNFKPDLIVGSSNLTAQALSTNKEWNIKVSALDEWPGILLGFSH